MTVFYTMLDGYRGRATHVTSIRRLSAHGWELKQEGIESRLVIKDVAWLHAEWSA